MTITETTPVDLDLRAMTDTELLDLYRSDGTAAAAALTEAERRDHAAHMTAARSARDAILAEGYDAAYAQYLKASEYTRGELLSELGKKRVTDEMSLWAGSEATAMRYASEELQDFWLFVEPRMSPGRYARQRGEAARIEREQARDEREASTDEHIHRDQRFGRTPELAGHEAGSLRRDETPAEAPQAGPGRAMDRSRPGRPALGEPEAGTGGGQRTGRPGGPIQRDRLTKGAGDMGLIMDGIRVAEMASRAARNSNGRAPHQADSDGPSGSIPAPADCSAEAVALNGLSEEELRQVGQQHLEEACQFIDRFSILPSRAAGWGLVLFAAHNWIYRAFTDTPRFHITALEYGAGKTRVMELASLLCPNPQMMAKITGPALYHIIDERHPAPLCLDEADVIFGQGQRGEELRGILNAGYKYNGTITRVSKGEAADFSVFCPAMFAGKGKLPKSLEDRSISIMMTRRRPGQQMDRFIPKMHDAMGRKIGLMLGAWATKIQGPAGDILWDEPPAELADRQVDILTPLYAIAQMAGGPGRSVSRRWWTCSCSAAWPPMRYRLLRRCSRLSPTCGPRTLSGWPRTSWRTSSRSMSPGSSPGRSRSGRPSSTRGCGTWASPRCR